jgi:hypothetical protein
MCGSSAECESGEVCCGTYNVQGRFYERITCMDACPAAAGNFTYPRFCTFNTSECPQGTTCRPSTELWGYWTCQ